VAQAQHGPHFLHALKIYKGMVMVVSSEGLLQSFQYSWVQSLIDFKKKAADDWILVFAKAL